ncbi:uncharacterized protein LOC144442027 [Glandiceps talaboti]
MADHNNTSDLVKCELLSYTTLHVAAMPQSHKVVARPTRRFQMNIRGLPKDYMFWSLFNCVCCCWLLGAFAIKKSFEVQTALLEEDLQQAMKASEKAKRINMFITVSGCLTLVTFIAVVFATGFYYKRI